MIRGSNRSWYYPSGLMNCNSELNTVKPILESNYDIKSILKVLLGFVSNWG